MFYRDVRMPDGRVLTMHEAVQITHVKGPSMTYVEVNSWGSPTDAQPYSSTHSKALDPSLGFEAAEEWLQTLPDFNDPVQEKLDSVLEILTDEQAETVPDAFPAWAAGIAYAVGVRVRYGGVLYKCVQAHTSQDGWTPDATPALWTRIGEPGDEWPEWVQPTGAQDAYAMGAKVSHDGAHWTSDVDANVWEPGEYGWTEVA